MTPTAPSEPACGTRTGVLPRSGSASRTPPLHRLDQRGDPLVDAAEAGVEVRLRQPIRVGEDRARRAAPQPEQRHLGPRVGPATRARLVRLHRHEEVTGGWTEVPRPARGAWGEREPA